jgi:hypothetical protein
MVIDVDVVFADKDVGLCERRNKDKKANKKESEHQHAKSW